MGAQRQDQRGASQKVSLECSHRRSGASLGAKVPLYPPKPNIEVTARQRQGGLRVRRERRTTALEQKQVQI